MILCAGRFFVWSGRAVARREQACSSTKRQTADPGGQAIDRRNWRGYSPPEGVGAHCVCCVVNAVGWKLLSERMRVRARVRMDECAVTVVSAISKMMLRVAGNPGLAAQAEWGGWTTAERR